METMRTYIHADTYSEGRRQLQTMFDNYENKLFISIYNKNTVQKSGSHTLSYFIR